MYAPALARTVPSRTSDHRQHVLEENPLLSFSELFAPIPDPCVERGCAMVT